MADTPPDLGHVRDWVFDLDNTLYPARTVFPEMDRRMTQFVAGYLGIGHDEALAIQKRYYAEHGNTLRGMMERHRMAPGGFLHHVHEIDLSAVPRCDLLASAMGRLEGRKFIYTNGSKRHAERMAVHLGIDHLLEGISGIEDGGYRPKPEPQAYRTFCDTHSIEPQQAIFFEDMSRNLLPAHEMGFTTVLVTAHDIPPGEPKIAHDRPAGDDRAPHIHYLTSDLAAFLDTAASSSPKSQD